MEHPATAHTGRDPTRLSVLVVDDTVVNRRLLEAMLHKMGHDVTLADGAEQGLALFRSVAPDLVLLDVSMPLMDGFEVARIMRRSDARVPIFFISALTSNDDVVRGLDAGGDDYLFKPVNYEILRSKIAAFQSRLATSVKLAEQNQRLLDYRERMEDETATAREFIRQFTALDKISDPLVRFQLKPAEKNFSGDLIAVARTPDDRLHVLLADSAGHGLTAALAVIPITQPFYQMTAKGFYVPAIVREINRRVRDYLPLPRFVAAVMLSLDPNERTIQVWNGGCPSALLLNQQGDEVLHEFVSRHLPLGVVAPSEFDAATEYYACAQDGGHVLMCTDGVTEITTESGGNLDQASLLSGARQSAAAHLFDRIVEVVEGQLQGAAPDDDIAMIVVDCAAQTAVPDLPLVKQPVTGKEQLCSAAAIGEPLWNFAVTLTAGQLKRLDVVPFLLNIAAQIDGGNADGKLFLVLSELFNNALDHGLLKLDSALKSQEDGMESYLAERASRLAELRQGQIVFSIERLECGPCACLKISIRDSGDGFDIHLPHTSDLQHNRKGHGRGIALLRAMCNELYFPGNGSEAVAYLEVKK